jgi:methylthioribose-1-phosphate isomerase
MDGSDGDATAIHSDGGNGGGLAPAALKWDGASLHVLDQTLLPANVQYMVCSRADDVADCISDMKVRGAPAIGAAAAYGMLLAALEAQRELSGDLSASDLVSRLSEAADRLVTTRPTAVNLKWAVERVLSAAREAAESGESGGDVLARAQAEADAIAREDVEMNRRIGQHGASLLGSDVTVLTHCNTGSLATVGYGTALGVIRAAVAMGRRVRVFAGETRPFLQGSRLTVYELMSEGIDVTLVVDSAVASLMKQGRIDAAIVGADRITANGDVANKIGTYSIACLARMHGVPFYVAAPTSTVDLSLTVPDEIPIEERSAEEVTHVAGKRVAPAGAKVFNPAFDVTPSCLVSAIITEHGVLRPPYPEALRAVCRSQAEGASRG